MKKLLVVLLLVTGITANAAVATKTSNVATNDLVTATGLVLQSLTLTTTNTAVTTVKLYDDDKAPYGSWTNAAYVSTATYTSNNVENYVSLTGVTNFITNAVSYTLLVTNSAATNALSPVWIGTVSSTAPVSLSGLGMRFNRGMAMSNNAAGITATILYTPTGW
jgi:hypothetical protein